MMISQWLPIKKLILRQWLCKLYTFIFRGRWLFLLIFVNILCVRQRTLRFKFVKPHSVESCSDQSPSDAIFHLLCESNFLVRIRLRYFHQKHFFFRAQAPWPKCSCDLILLSAHKASCTLFIFLFFLLLLSNIQITTHYSTVACSKHWLEQASKLL